MTNRRKAQLIDVLIACTSGCSLVLSAWAGTAGYPLASAVFAVAFAANMFIAMKPWPEGY